ncbi:SDR family NAD(P)-dependent oxidoreductase [Streptomyces pseudogriseolus]|uniref:SDR family NAD(P)-dependent oxidoreductase n=1 Tax=Streptomyces pseudogriseolus TaxID=36817 RepID=UPI003494241C
MTEERTILVTGATDGVGRRAVERLAAPGVHLLVHGRSTGRGKAVTGHVERAGGSATFLEADFDSLAEVRALAERVRAEHPHLDVLVATRASVNPTVRAK